MTEAAKNLSLEKPKNIDNNESSKAIFQSMSYISPIKHENNENKSNNDNNNNTNYCSIDANVQPPPGFESQFEAKHNLNLEEMHNVDSDDSENYPNNNNSQRINSVNSNIKKDRITNKICIYMCI